MCKRRATEKKLIQPAIHHLAHWSRDPAFVEGDDSFGDCQAQPGACGVGSLRLGHTIEGLEDICKLIYRYASSMASHLYRCLVYTFNLVVNRVQSPL
jgi:hypothetical protein